VEVVIETRRSHFIRYLSLYYYHWVDISAAGLLVPLVIIHPVVSVSTLTWFIGYIYYWNFQFLNNVIIIKRKVSQRKVILADFDYPVFWFLDPTDF